MDREDEAAQVWEQILALPETPVTYLAWRELARVRVRSRDLPGAQKAYLEAQRRAPPEDRAEIASRLGWLAKETGDSRRANRYFAASRGGTGTPIVTLSLIAITSVISVLAFSPDSQLFELLALDKFAVADGEYWRLFTVTLLHGGFLHLIFNMYALYLAGSLVEQLYGPRLYLAIYLLSAAAGSVGSYLFGGDIPSVGASGAVFGLFGVLLAVSRTHHPVLDRRGQMLLGQIGGLILINLLFGFGLAGVGGGIDNAAHVGGLIAGLWLGFLLVPGRVPTLGSLWQRPAANGGAGGAGAPGSAGSANGVALTAAVNDRAAMLLRFLGVVALIVAIIVGVMIGTQMRQDGRRGEQTGERTALAGGIVIDGAARQPPTGGTGSADRSLPTS
jgi:membrane associated rhomboid family serine protease